MSNGLIPDVETEIEEKTNNMSQEDVVKNFMDLVENGEVKSFIITGIDHEGKAILATHVDDVYIGLGMLETAKYIIYSGY